MSKAHIPLATERIVRLRAQGQCEYCRCLSNFHSDPFAIEHILPEARGGTATEANLALSCPGSNSFNGRFLTGYDTVTEREQPLFHPRNQRWSDHFARSHNTTEMIGVSATARATINRLRLNRPGLVNLRTALRRFGVHPPE